MPHAANRNASTNPELRVTRQAPNDVSNDNAKEKKQKPASPEQMGLSGVDVDQSASGAPSEGALRAPRIWAATGTVP